MATDRRSSPSFEIRFQFMAERHVLYLHAAGREGRGVWRNLGADRATLPLDERGMRMLLEYISLMVGPVVLRQLGAALSLDTAADGVTPSA
jgi:hypothetical protein